MNSKSYIAAIVTISSTLINLSNAEAQDKCGQVLESELFNKSVSQSDRRATSAEKAFACKASLSEVRDYVSNQQSQGGGGQGSLSYGLFSVSGGGGSQSASSLTQSQLNKWKQSNCSNRSASQSQSSFEYFAQSVVASGVVDAWKTCMQARENLTCWGSPQGESVVFTANWKSSEIELPVVTSTTISERARVVGSGVGEKKLFDNNEKLSIGQVTRIIERDPADDVIATLNIKVNNRYAYSCAVFVPAEVQIPKTITAMDANGKATSTFKRTGLREWKEHIATGQVARFQSTSSGPDSILLYDAGRNINVELDLVKLKTRWQYPDKDWIDLHKSIRIDN